MNNNDMIKLKAFKQEINKIQNILYRMEDEEKSKQNNKRYEILTSLLHRFLIFKSSYIEMLDSFNIELLLSIWEHKYPEPDKIMTYEKDELMERIRYLEEYTTDLQNMWNTLIKTLKNEKINIPLAITLSSFYAVSFVFNTKKIMTSIWRVFIHNVAQCS